MGTATKPTLAEIIISTLAAAFNSKAATTETRKTGEAYTDMATLFGMILHDLAENLKWKGFEASMMALKDHDGFEYFGNPYDGKLIDACINGYTEPPTREEQKAEADAAIAAQKALTAFMATNPSPDEIAAYLTKKA